MEDCINLEELNLVNYLRQSEERLLKSAWRRRNRSELEHPNDYKRRKHEEQDATERTLQRLRCGTD